MGILLNKAIVPSNILTICNDIDLTKNKSGYLWSVAKLVIMCVMAIVEIYRPLIALILKDAP